MDRSLFSQKERMSTPQTHYCPKCKSELVSRYHTDPKKQGHRHFLGCSNYPSCDYSESTQQDGHIVKILDVSCPECQQILVLRNGRYGMFIGCSGFPNCDYIASLKDPSLSQEEEDFIACPECAVSGHNGKLVPRKTRYGTTFYSCDDYPRCKFSIKGKPIAMACPKCGYALMMVLKPGADPVCAAKKCQLVSVTRE